MKHIKLTQSKTTQNDNLEDAKKVYEKFIRCNFKEFAHL
jgi:hypothetical protein